MRHIIWQAKHDIWTQSLHGVHVFLCLQLPEPDGGQDRDGRVRTVLWTLYGWDTSRPEHQKR